ncbi:MAG: glycosyltransferase family 4 protein [Cyanobacteria bacterium J06632_19]
MLVETTNPNKILVTHLLPGPFVQQVAIALFEHKMLAGFATTLIDKPNSKQRNLLCNLAKTFNYDLAHQLSRRVVNELPQSLVRDYPWQELVRLVVSRVDKQKILTDLVFHWEVNGYDNWVARKHLSNVDSIYGYEYACLKSFQAAAKQGIARIYDVPSPEHDFVENLLEIEYQNFPELQTPYRKYCRARQTQRTQKRRAEWELADVVITNSQFTKASYQAAGLDVTKMRVVPLAAPTVCSDGIYGGTQEQEPIKFLWAGTFSVRKGAHYLLQAWKQLQLKNKARLEVFGAMGLPSSLVENLPDSINISGTVPHSELFQYYQQADVLLFPTLCDGFGMVVTEAFAHGLPVITTDRAGAADLVRHHVNGLIIPAGDVNALAEAMEWCITHRQELKAMRQPALETAANWQWWNYRQALVTNILDGLKTAGYQV